MNIKRHLYIVPAAGLFILQIVMKKRDLSSKSNKIFNNFLLMKFSSINFCGLQVSYTSRFMGCRSAGSISRSATASEIMISLMAAIGKTYGAYSIGP